MLHSKSYKWRMYYENYLTGFYPFTTQSYKFLMTLFLFNYFGVHLRMLRHLVISLLNWEIHVLFILNYAKIKIQ